MKYSTNFVTSLKKLTKSNHASKTIKEDRKDSGVSLYDDCKEASKGTESNIVKKKNKSKTKRYSNVFNNWGKSKDENTFDSDRSPYFIQTWWDPAMPSSLMEKEVDQSPRSKPLYLVPYLPPIWVDEEMESISPDTTLVNDEGEEEEVEVEKEEEFVLTVSMYDSEEEEEQQQTLPMCQNQIPMQDSSFLTVPLQASKSERMNNKRKVRFEIGARLDPNEDCLLNCIHPIHGKRQHKHANKCHHVRFILLDKEEEDQEGKKIRFPKHKRDHRLKSCLKIQAQTESLNLINQNKVAPKSILRLRNESSKGKEEKVQKVTFDEQVEIHSVDRYIKYEQDVSTDQSLQQLARANRVEKRKEIIRTRPIVNDVEQDEGFYLDEEMEEIDSFQQSKTEQDRSDKPCITCHPDHQFAEKHPDFFTWRHLHSFNEQIDFSRSIIHKIRFERQWLPLVFFQSEIESIAKVSQESQ